MVRLITSCGIHRDGEQRGEGQGGQLAWALLPPRGASCGPLLQRCGGQPGAITLGKHSRTAQIYEDIFYEFKQNILDCMNQNLNLVGCRFGGT